MCNEISLQKICFLLEGERLPILFVCNGISIQSLSFFQEGDFPDIVGVQ